MGIQQTLVAGEGAVGSARSRTEPALLPNPLLIFVEAARAACLLVLIAWRSNLLQFNVTT